jgi:cation:H+ antiporter
LDAEVDADVWFSWLMLVVGLLVILLGCDIFTNSIEWLGKKLNLNEGVLGSIFAAVGTALPETLIPIVALIVGAMTPGGTSHANDVGLGAIIGAPFMLATVAMLVTGTAVFFFTVRGRRTVVLRVNSRVLSRDIRFFLLAFAIAVSMSFVPSEIARILVALGLVAYYFFYVYKHATDKSGQTTEEDVEELSPLHFSRKSNDPSLQIVIVQTIAGLALIVGAAYLFVLFVEDVAHSIGVTSLILSLIVVPLATELPEKFNSVIWVRRSKDTLALGNITGAMVFQSTLPVSIGMVFTEWTMSAEYAPAFAQAVFAIIAALLLFASMVLRGRLTAVALVLSGIWYVAWLVLVFPVDIESMIRGFGWFS